MPPVSDIEEHLTRLEAKGETGCLTITSANGAECRVYLLSGRPLHAVSGSLTGRAAVDNALTWRDASLSFDPSAELPEDAAATVFDEPEKQAGARKLEDDATVTAMRSGAMAALALMLLIPFGLIGVALVATRNGSGTTLVILLAVGSGIFFFVLFVVLYLAAYIVLLRNAVRVAGGVPKGAIPRVVGGSHDPSPEKPALVVTMQVRCLLGRIGKCRVEVLADRLRIWRGPRQPEPRWEVAYRDLLQVELIDQVLYSTGGGIPHQYFVRIILGEPRMAFLLGGAWRVTAQGNKSALRLFDRLRKHNVPAFDELLT